MDKFSQMSATETTPRDHYGRQGTYYNWVEAPDHRWEKDLFALVDGDRLISIDPVLFLSFIHSLT